MENLTIRKRRSAIPWWSIFSMGYIVFIILYQVSPEFQAWVNYSWRYWSRYPVYAAKYSAYVAKSGWRKIPNV